MATGTGGKALRKSIATGAYYHTKVDMLVLGARGMSWDEQL